MGSPALIFRFRLATLGTSPLVVVIHRIAYSCVRPSCRAERWPHHTTRTDSAQPWVWTSGNVRRELYHRIANRKLNQIAVVAVARELVGFLWAVMKDLEEQKAAA